MRSHKEKTREKKKKEREKEASDRVDKRGEREQESHMAAATRNNNEVHVFHFFFPQRY